MVEQEVVLVNDPRAKTPHVGVVILVLDPAGYSFVLCGTTQAAPGTDGEFVDRNTSAYKALGLRQPTWFYPRNVVAALPAAVSKLPGRCPLTLFTRLQEVAAAGWNWYGSNIPLLPP